MPRKTTTKKSKKVIETKSSAPITNSKVKTPVQEKEPETIEEFKEKVSELEQKVSQLEEIEEKYNKVLLASKTCYLQASIDSDKTTNQLKEIITSTFGLDIGDI